MLQSTGCTPRIAPMIADMKWAFLKANEDYKYLTNDYPVASWDKFARITFPVTKDIALMAFEENTEGYFLAQNDTIKRINERTIASASDYIFSSEKKIWWIKGNNL